VLLATNVTCGFSALIPFGLPIFAKFTILHILEGS